MLMACQCLTMFVCSGSVTQAELQKHSNLPGILIRVDWNLPAFSLTRVNGYTIWLVFLNASNLQTEVIEWNDKHDKIDNCLVCVLMLAIKWRATYIFCWGKELSK